MHNHKGGLGPAAVIIAALVWGAASSALAQDVSYKRKTVINFEDDTIEGDLKTPDGEYLISKKKLRHRSLIRIRREFKREVLGSFADL